MVQVDGKLARDAIFPGGKTTAMKKAGRVTGYEEGQLDEPLGCIQIIHTCHEGGVCVSRHQ